MDKSTNLYPFLVTLLAIAVLCLMDVFMKGAAIAVGAYSALMVRSVMQVSLVTPVWLATGGKWPAPHVLKIHITRSLVATFMALTFFSAIVLLPLAEAIALSFISPLIALALAALILKETIEKKAIIAAIMGIAGVGIIVGGRIGRESLSDDAALGIALVLISAVLYAWNLILQRQQALVAKPIEITAFGGAIVGLTLLLGAPFFFSMPHGAAWLDIAVAALLGVCGSLALSWAYARAEAQVLVPVEYTGFAWAALFGWLFFAEDVKPATLAGAALIILGCWIAAPRKHTEQAVTGAGQPQA
ncbi:DMT family transporter [Alteraurantiacibacter aestuarii]|uniref:EamA family transporter n=1 Tax=Alteraurantiacibacter aestuarii TaxID=650004 RepID=A0A844ZP84_9SPHN|nr:DMT family transporter [Alteraurantiacibacter aestuarii]MXO89152.1 EamA family transporter [Alteraurantiacibacter aestuarii]